MFRFSSEQQSKAKMAAEIEELKREYEDKLKEVTVSHNYQMPLLETEL